MRFRLTWSEVRETIINADSEEEAIEIWERQDDINSSELVETDLNSLEVEEL